MEPGARAGRLVRRSGSDLGGTLTPDRFAEAKNATHDDILFSPSKTPEINVPQVRMIRGAKTEVLIENFIPAAYMRGLLKN